MRALGYWAFLEMMSRGKAGSGFGSILGKHWYRHAMTKVYSRQSINQPED